MDNEGWVTLSEMQLDSDPSWQPSWTWAVRHLVDLVYSKTRRPLPPMGYTFHASYDCNDRSKGAYIQVWEPTEEGGCRHAYAISSRSKQVKDKTVPSGAAYRALPRGADTACLDAICNWLFATYEARVREAQRAERKRQREEAEQAPITARKLARLEAGEGNEDSNVCEGCGRVKFFCAAPKCLELSRCPYCDIIDEVWVQHARCAEHPRAMYCDKHRRRYLVECQNCEEWDGRSHLWRCKAQCVEQCEGCGRRVCFKCLEEGTHDCDEPEESERERSLEYEEADEDKDEDEDEVEDEGEEEEDEED